MKTRIHKILADHGIGSRRGIESLIKQKKVLVNGQLAIIGQLVSEKDVFEIEGQTVRLSKKDPTKKRIIMPNLQKNIENLCQNEFLLWLNSNKKIAHTLLESLIERSLSHFL